MLKLKVSILFFLVLSSCSSQGLDSNLNSKMPNDTSKLKLSLLGDSFYWDFRLNSNRDYSITKSKIETLRKAYATHYSGLSEQAQKKYLDTINANFVNLLLNDLIPHWYGTEWDFNGITSNPKQGEIACGYFVSTTLLHMGIKVNRYRMAQQGGTNEAKTLAVGKGTYWKRIKSNFNNTLDMFKDVHEGLYFVGLDNHVGYFYKINGKCYFINSDYYTDKVEGSPIEESVVFNS